MSCSCKSTDWRAHKKVCSIDAAASEDSTMASLINNGACKSPRQERNIFEVDHDCHHRGPSPKLVVENGTIKLINGLLIAQVYQD